MSRGQHAADDGSFPRSAGGAMARGIGLIVVAVILGVVLLRSTDSPEPFTPTASATDDTDETTDSTKPADDGDDTTTTTIPPAHDPAQVAVLVANGTGSPGVQGLAGDVADRLRPENYLLKEPTNTETAVEASVVYFAPGYEADAKLIAGLLTPAPGVQPMPTPAPVADLAGAHVLVVAAADLAAG